MNRIIKRHRAKGKTEKTSTSLTFDRKTFLECSARMMRTAPTLDWRQQNNPEDQIHTSSSTPKCLEERNDADENVNENDFKRKFHEVGHVASSSTWRRSRSMELMDEIVLTDDGEDDITLPATTIMCSNTSYLQSPSSPEKIKHATLPILNNTRKAFKKQLASESGSLWMRPLLHLATFMSTIGNNLDITSYPTP